MSIYQSQEVPFVPTYLYIKQHSETGKLYFGKTTYKDPVNYPGSGDYWKSHIKVHGKEHVETLWYCLFTEKEELVKFALGCSEQWDIVKSKDEFENKIWANLKPENGLDGALSGIHHFQKGKQLSEETKKKISDKSKGDKNGFFNKTHSIETKEKIGLANLGYKPSDETIEKLRIAATGVIQSEETKKKISKSNIGRKWSEDSKSNLIRPKSPCKYCNRSFTPAALARHHGENCKEKYYFTPSP